MDLRQLRHFVAVAEELHFGRAATRLGMAQPPLSNSIMRLEESLQAKLLERSSRQVNLTAAGKALVQEANRILDQVSFAEQTVRRVAAGKLTRLRMAIVPMSAMRILPRAVRLFNKRHPEVEVELDEMVSREQVQALQQGNIDVGILVRNIISTEGLAVRSIERSGVVAAVPEKWTNLSQRHSVKLVELAKYPFVLALQPTKFYPALVAACQRAGFTPTLIQRVGNPYTMFNLVANELGIGLVQDTARDLEVKGVSFVEIEDLPESFYGEIAVAWVPRAVSPTVMEMVKIIEEVAIKIPAINK